MKQTRTRSLEAELADLPIHGPDGRVAYVRHLLGMRQADFAATIGVSRETVSHWENVGPDGNPRARARRRHSAAIASLVLLRLGASVPAGTFFAPRETALESFLKELQDVKEELGRLRSRVDTSDAWAISERGASEWEGSDDELLDAQQASALLTVGPKTLLAWARDGRVPCIRLDERVVRWTRPMLRGIRDDAVQPSHSHVRRVNRRDKN